MAKYDDFTKEELLALVQKQDGELASKKYGLVWDAEREPEQVVLDCEHNLPVLKRVKGKAIYTDLTEDNILIEGDNYHALTVLNYTHREKIDVIYIDPPYNTGNKDFKYNDRFVDREDGFRHSKWLNFMEKRLNLAKDLLKKTGVIFISIDDNEQAQLKLLCDKVFGESNLIAQFIVIRAEGGGLAKQAVIGHEYVLVYSRNIDIFNPLRKEKDVRGKIVAIDGEDYVIEEDWLRKEFGKYGTLLYDEIEKVKGVEKKMEIDRGIVQGKYVILDKPQGKIVGRYKKLSDEGSKFYTILKHLNKNGKNDLLDLGLGDVFDYPKPKSLLKELIRGATFFSKGGIILDYMAGSGTTGHAVLELNNEDGGNRTFILCTNNENDICENVTYPRLQKVIKGYKKNGDGEKVAGLGGNLQYFKTDLVKQTHNKDQMRLHLTHKCTEMLCVKENVFNLTTEKDDCKIFTSNTGDRFLCVYYSMFDESFADFVKEVKKLRGDKRVYVFSADGRVNRQPFARIKDCAVEEIPQKILEVYRQLVKMNIPVKSDTIFLDFEKAQVRIFERKEKDEGARTLRVVLEKTIQKIAQKSGLSIFTDRQKEEKVSVLNDKLKDCGVFTKVQWEENKTYLTIGNNASHGDYSDYDLKHVENFYRHVQSLFNDFGI